MGRNVWGLGGPEVWTGGCEEPRRGGWRPVGYLLQQNLCHSAFSVPHLLRNGEATDAQQRVSTVSNFIEKAGAPCLT